MADDSRQKQFDVLFSTLGNLQTGVMSGTSQVAGFLLVVIGWLATSEKALGLLPSHSPNRSMVAVALVAAFGFYVYGVAIVYSRSQHTFKMLTRLDFMPSEYFKTNVLGLSELAVFIGGNAFLVGVILVILFH